MSHNSDGRGKVAALCVSGRSIYKHLPGVEAYDERRDARTFPGGMPVVAHPPCRCWSKYLSHQAKPPDRESEMRLGLWCVEQVLTWGGVLEHPYGSRLFATANLPLPNSQDKNPFLYTLTVSQSWWGYATPKPTWVLVCGVPRREIPDVPFSLGDGARAKNLSKFQRSRSVTPFAEWLCQIARSTWLALPRANALAAYA